MLTRKDLRYEIKKALERLTEIAELVKDNVSIKALVEVLRIIAKLIMLCLKLLLNLRDNQQAIKRHFDIKDFKEDNKGEDNNE